jgi:HAAS
MASSADNMVGRYLAQLDDELRKVPAPRRREVMQAIAGRIAASRKELVAETDADVRDILYGVGEPADIGAVARERFGVEERRSTWREIAALILLPFGGVIVPLAGWFLGVFFLWLSEAWTLRDKLIGTLVVPGGLLLPLVLLTIGGGANVLFVVLVALLLLAPFAAAGYLALRLRRR